MKMSKHSDGSFFFPCPAASGGTEWEDTLPNLIFSRAEGDLSPFQPLFFPSSFLHQSPTHLKPESKRGQGFFFIFEKGSVGG